MKITVSNWLISILNLYSYPVYAFAYMTGAGCCYVGGQIRVYLYSATYNSANNTINVIFIFDPSTCNNPPNMYICSLVRFDNPNSCSSGYTGPATTNWCNYSVYEVISLIGAN